MKIRVLESRASNFAETLTNNISNTFKCDIDDVQWDEGSYPKKAKMSFVVYNVSAKTAEDIRDKVEQYLSDSGYDIWPGHSVDFEKDFSYVSGSIKSAYRIYFSVKKAAFLESASERFLDYDSAVNYVENRGISLDVAGNDFANMIIDDFEELANEDEEFSTVKLDRFIQWAKQESLKYEDDDDSCTEAKKRAQQVRKMFNADTEHEEMIKESISNTNLVDNPEKPKKSRPSGKLQRQIEDSAINELGGSMFDPDGYYGKVVEMPSKVSITDISAAISNGYRKNGYETIFWTRSGSESLEPTKEFSVVFGSSYESVDYIIGVDTENSARGKKYYTIDVNNVY